MHVLRYHSLIILLHCSPMFIQTLLQSSPCFPNVYTCGHTRYRAPRTQHISSSVPGWVPRFSLVLPWAYHWNYWWLWCLVGDRSVWDPLNIWQEQELQLGSFCLSGISGVRGGGTPCQDTPRLQELPPTHQHNYAAMNLYSITNNYIHTFSNHFSEIYKPLTSMPQLSLIKDKTVFTATTYKNTIHLLKINYAGCTYMMYSYIQNCMIPTFNLCIYIHTYFFYLSS